MATSADSRRWTPGRWCTAQLTVLLLVFAVAGALLVVRLAVLVRG